MTANLLLNMWRILTVPLFLILVSLQRNVWLHAFTHSPPQNSRRELSNNEGTMTRLLFAKEQQEQQQQRRRFAQAKTQQSYVSDSKLGSMYNQRIKTAGRKGTKRFVDPCKVFIGNLPFDIDEKQLGNFILDTMGQSRMVLHSFKVIYDWKTGKSKGYGFVEFTDPIYASVCMDVCNGKKFNGRPIKVDQGKKKDVEDQVFIKKNKKPETEEEKSISSALDEAENDDDYDTEELETDKDGVALFGDNDEMELDAILFGLAADSDDEDDGIFLERPSKFEEDIDPDLNREQRREASRKLKRKKLPTKGFG
mmetsp:Transcript_1246/g.1417  ORF Transcript_1246/g.1417 Transcript_1246/m.1417 type:complete len:309 (-) Transcript_1246:31-957(-)